MSLPARLPALLALLAPLVIASACGPEGNDDGGTDTQDTVDDSDTPGTDTPDSDDDSDGDSDSDSDVEVDTDCELPAGLVDATAVTFDGDAVGAGFTAASEQDAFSFSFSGTAPAWVRIYVTSTPASDTAVTLLDACGVQIARNDTTFLNNEGNLYTRLDAAGTYYVVVEEGVTLRGSGTSAAPFTYQLAVEAIDATTPGVNLSSGANNDNATAQTVSFVGRNLDATAWPNSRLTAEKIERRNVDYAVLLGVHDGDPDDDLFTWARVGSDSRLSSFSVRHAAGGTDGTGSPSDNTVYYFAPGRPGDGNADPDDIKTVSTFPSDYFLRISPAAGATSGFYVVELLRVDDFF